MSLNTPSSNGVQALLQFLHKPETALAVQLQTGKYCFSAFLYQARVLSVLSPICSCGFGHQTAKHIIIYCRNFSAAWHTLRYDQGHRPHFQQLFTTPTGLQKVKNLGDAKGDPGPLPLGQRLPLPTRALFPSQQLSWTMILVQQDSYIQG